MINSIKWYPVFLCIQKSVDHTANHTMQQRGAPYAAYIFQVVCSIIH